MVPDASLVPFPTRNLTMSNTTEAKQPFNLSRWAIGHPSIARFLFGLIILTGVFGLMNMGQKEDPDFTFRVMVVQAVWPGASIQEMEDQVVNKIERKLQETPHLDFVRSYTRAGSAIITLQVEGDTVMADPRSEGGWRETVREKHPAEGPTPAFDFVTLERS